MFFFSSRRRHTRWPRDWSSDVCSSDLNRNVFTGESLALAVQRKVVDVFVHQNGGQKTRTGNAFVNNALRQLANTNSIGALIFRGILITDIPFDVKTGGFQLQFIGYLLADTRSEEHTSELQSRGHLVCRLLLEKKN